MKLTVNRRWFCVCYMQNTRHLIIALFILISVSFKCAAQQNEGIIYYRVIIDEYKMHCSMEFFNKADAERDKNKYTFGISTSYTNLYFNRKKTKYEAKRDDGSSLTSSDFLTSQNLLNNTITIITPINEKTYLINDTLNAPGWLIQNDIREIAGHICMSAITFDSLRKQNVKAWFAMDIPLSIGPDRWYGLPGVILEIDLNKGAVVITADKIEFSKLTTELNIPKTLKGTAVTQKEYNEIFKKYYDHSVAIQREYYYNAPY